MSPRIIQLPMSGGDRKHYLRELKIAEQAHARLKAQIEDGYSTVHSLLSQEWNTRQFIGGPADPSPTLAQAIHGGYVLLEVKCKRCGHESMVDLTQVIWPRSNQIHTLAKVLHCQSCRNERKSPPADLVALWPRQTPGSAAPAMRQAKR